MMQERKQGSPKRRQARDQEEVATALGWPGSRAVGERGDAGGKAWPVCPTWHSRRERGLCTACAARPDLGGPSPGCPVVQAPPLLVWGRQQPPRLLLACWGGFGSVSPKFTSTWNLRI